jgi:hypothetical protein
MKNSQYPDFGIMFSALLTPENTRFVEADFGLSKFLDLFDIIERCFTSKSEKNMLKWYALFYLLYFGDCPLKRARRNTYVFIIPSLVFVTDHIAHLTHKQVKN